MNNEISEIPLISIIVPSFNHGALIIETLKSIFDQKRNNVEVIVVDGKSTDCTIDVLKEFDGTPNYFWLSEPDSGQSCAINKGMRLARGNIVSWLNSDDLLFSGSLENVENAFFNNPEASMVIGCGEKIDLQGNTLKMIPYQKYSKFFFKHSMTVLQPSIFFTKDSFFKAGCIDESLIYAMDWDLFMKISKLGKCICIDKYLAKLRVYNSTKTSSGSWARSREIAKIGFCHNGYFDRNFISYSIRLVLGKIFSSDHIRHIIDRIMIASWKRNGFMIKNWPS